MSLDDIKIHGGESPFNFDVWRCPECGRVIRPGSYRQAALSLPCGGCHRTIVSDYQLWPSKAVRVGQVWADNDKKLQEPRYLRVKAIHNHKAKCWSYYSNEAAGRFVWIRLDRFQPISTGYRLIADSIAPALNTLVRNKK